MMKLDRQIVDRIERFRERGAWLIECGTMLLLGVIGMVALGLVFQPWNLAFDQGFAGRVLTPESRVFDQLHVGWDKQDGRPIDFARLLLLTLPYVAVVMRSLNRFLERAFGFSKGVRIFLCGICCVTFIPASVCCLMYPFLKVDSEFRKRWQAQWKMRIVAVMASTLIFSLAIDIVQMSSKAFTSATTYRARVIFPDAKLGVPADPVGEVKGLSAPCLSCGVMGQPANRDRTTDAEPQARTQNPEPEGWTNIDPSRLEPVEADMALYVLAQNARLTGRSELIAGYLSGMSGAWRPTADHDRQRLARLVVEETSAGDPALAGARESAGDAMVQQRILEWVFLAHVGMMAVCSMQGVAFLVLGHKRKRRAASLAIHHRRVIPAT